MTASPLPGPSDPIRRKGLGAYYTAQPVVSFLVQWGLEAGGARIMDPSCGDGRFLAEAVRRGANAVIGCDIDPAARAATRAALADIDPPVELHDGDFFALEPEQVAPVDLVVGNPPFIRYQQFTGASRRRALASSLRVGARLSRLSASWAPFLLHALQFLRPGGAMGIVVPAELAQTSYGLETLRALCASFGQVRLISFCRNWFEDAQQETFLLLARERGGTCTSAELTPLERIDDLATLFVDAPETAANRFALTADRRVGLAFMPEPARGLYLALLERPEPVPLRTLGSISNGYVSGANDFFHCTVAEAADRGLPAAWLLPVARNSRSLTGLTFDRIDLASAERTGVAHHLILPRDSDLFAKDDDALRQFIERGECDGIDTRYKCRVRRPWWRVPGLIQADLLLPYMIGSEPHAAVNRAHALYPNSLHGLRLGVPALAEPIALALLSTFSLLSMELEGRSYGGGILKLEPSELERVRLCLPHADADTIAAAFNEADARLRAGDFAGAVAVADGLVLEHALGLNKPEQRVLADGRRALVERRLSRSGKRSARHD